jgi:hypothetical protein
MKCHDIHVYMKTECLETKWDTALFEWKGKDRVALIKSLIWTRVGRGTWGAHYKRYKWIWSN